MIKKTPKPRQTRAAAESEGAKVIRVTPKNCFDPEKWPSTKNYFYVKNYRAVQDEEGKTVFEQYGLVNSDTPSYDRDSYCLQRIGKELGLRPEDNMIAAVGRYGRCWVPIFQSDDKDNIDITYTTLDRELIELIDHRPETQTLRQSDNDRAPEYYKRKRLHPDNCKSGMKYLSPKKSECPNIYPFLPPQLIAAWEQGEQFDTLVITEGEMKAMKGCMCGGHVIGIAGIQMFYNTATHDVFTDVVRIIRDCGVKNLVYLQDGDCTDISKSAIESIDGSGQPNKDLADRPNDFMRAVRTFNSMYKKAAPRIKIYWAYINSKSIPGEPKGLDDLLLSKPEEQDRIISELENVDGVTAYFHRLNVSMELQKLSEHFALNSVEDFYKRHRNVIDPKPDKDRPMVFRMFLWFGTIYKWNEDKHCCEEILSRDMMAYIRIGTGWYKETTMPTAAEDKDGRNVMTEVLLPWSRQNITDDYGSDVIRKLRRYDGFVNLPSHENYRRVVKNFYNLYRPLVYKPSEEALMQHGFPYIYSTLEHIFGKDNRGRGLKPGDADYDNNSQFDIGADYFQLLYQKPTQNLPILCLVSTERGTGKTSLLNLMQVMFAENMVIVGSESLQSNFNALVSGRLAVGVDESALADNKEFTEKIKRWSTSSKQTVENKGKDPYQIDNYTKYVLCSNNETRFIYASSEEVRFWVRKVPPIDKDKKVGNVLPIYEEEMPAFLAWLNQRQLWFSPDDPKKVDRMYFPPELLHTEWLDALLEAQRPRAERKMRDWLHDWFIDFEKKELLATVSKLQEAISYSDSKFRTYDPEDLKRYIEENMHVSRHGGGSGKSKRFRFQIIDEYPTDDGLSVSKRWIDGNGRPYAFQAKDFLNPQEYYAIFKDERPQAKQASIEFDENQVGSAEDIISRYTGNED